MITYLIPQYNCVRCGHPWKIIDESNINLPSEIDVDRKVDKRLDNYFMVETNENNGNYREQRKLRCKCNKERKV